MNPNWYQLFNFHVWNTVDGLSYFFWIFVNGSDREPEFPHLGYCSHLFHLGAQEPQQLKEDESQRIDIDLVVVGFALNLFGALGTAEFQPGQCACGEESHHCGLGRVNGHIFLPLLNWDLSRNFHWIASIYQNMKFVSTLLNRREKNGRYVGKCCFFFI